MVGVLKYLLVIVVAGSWYAAAFLTYLMPTFAARLPWIGFACWFPAFFFSLSALFRKRWKAFAIFSATWVVFALPLLGVEQQFSWLRAQGFRIHAFPVEGYLSGCRLTEFVEKGLKQTVGDCESWGVVYDNVAYVVFYDTTGEIALPVSQRTPEWKDAMYNYSPKKVLRDSEGRAEHLSGSFYRIGIDHGEFDGG